jgi:hypothetical protein
MFTKEHLHLIPRDEEPYYAELALWELSFSATFPSETAILIGMAACFNSILLEEAESWLTQKPAMPATAYDAICWQIAEFCITAAREIHGQIGRPLDYLDWAEKVACYSARATWLRDLTREVRKALLRKWGGETPATYRAGAEAMKEAIKQSIRACHFDLKNSGPMTDALAAVDATPLPEPGDLL